MKYLLSSLFVLFFAVTLYGQDAVSDARQRAKDEKALQDYFTKNDIHPIKASGLYYVITREGAGRQILAGEQVVINYTGRYLDGKVFDSNTDTAFGKVMPLLVEIGAKKVIRGWDKGITKLKKGSVATLYIPSGMAYGPDGNETVPPNAILIFDVEILNVTR